MSLFLIRQAVYVPLAAMLIPIVVSWFVPGYSSLSQHMSELELLGGTPAMLTRVAAIVSGASIVGFALGLLGLSRHYLFSALACALFGLSMISNGVVVTGSPWHGLYGIGLICVLAPALFVAESPGIANDPRLRRWFLAAAVLTLLYMWLMITGLDPMPYRGLTQRIAVVFMFGWYALAGMILLRDDRRGEFRHP